MGQQHPRTLVAEYDQPVGVSGRQGLVERAGNVEPVLAFNLRLNGRRVSVHLLSIAARVSPGVGTSWLWVLGEFDRVRLAVRLDDSVFVHGDDDNHITSHFALIMQQ